MPREESEAIALRVPVDRARTRAYPWCGLLLGTGAGVFLGHPLSMVVLNIHQYVYNRAALQVGQAILNSFQPRMWR